MPAYEILPRYAEQPMIIIEAKDDAEAEKIAERMAKDGHAAGGYREGGSLCPVQVKDCL